MFYRVIDVVIEIIERFAPFPGICAHFCVVNGGV